jgi:hypothetical protein
MTYDLILKTAENQTREEKRRGENKREKFSFPRETNVRYCWHCGAALKAGDFAICDTCRTDAYRRNRHAFSAREEGEEWTAPLPDNDLGGDDFEDDWGEEL